MRAATVSALFVSTLLFVPLPGQSQPNRPNEIVIYRDRNYSGPAVAISQDESNLGLVWTVSSARVRSGVWQLCERRNFQGSCLTLSADSSNLGRRTVQSARLTRPAGGGAWRDLGRTDVNRIGWIFRTIRVTGNPRLSQVRLCAERTSIRFRDARARFANNRFQTLRVPSLVSIGRCTNAFDLASAPRNLTSVEMTASSVNVSRGRVRLEGR